MSPGQQASQSERELVDTCPRNPQDVGTVARELLFYSGAWLETQGISENVTRDDTEIVSAVQTALRDKVGTTRYRMWFENRVRWQLAGEQLQLLVRDAFTLERIRRSFQSELSEVIESLSGHYGSLTLQLRTDPSCDPADTSAAAIEPVDESPAEPAVQRETEVVADNSQRSWGRFESLVVGDANRIAVTAARMLPDRPGSISPLFLHGPPGSGKSHLLQSIWTEFRQRRQRSRSVYLTAEQFTSHFLEALRGSGLPSFRHKYRDVQLLLIDDVHFFVGKRATISELHYTIDSLLRDGRQLVFASHYPPAELQDLGMDLVARLSSGLVCGTEPADHAMRMQICQQYCQRQDCHFSSEIIDLLAQQLRGDVRLMHGAIHRLQAIERAFGKPVSVPAASSHLQDLFQVARRAVKLPEIEQAICHVFGLQPQSLQSSGRTRSVSQPRMLAMWLAREYTRAAYSEIGDFFGHRAHNTVISAHQRVNNWMLNNEMIQTPHGSWNTRDAIRRVETELQLA